jgi:hypothetical protein
VSETAAAPSPAARPLRWPWAIVAGFVVLVTYGSILVFHNGESFAGQAPFVVAFGMFCVVGALIVSRAPGNRIGGLLLYGSAITVVSFVGGELVTMLFRSGTTTGAPITFAAVLSSIGWVIGIIPVLLFLPLLFPDGHVLSPDGDRSCGSPSRSSCSSRRDPARAADARGSVDAAHINNPLYVPAFGNLEISDTVISAMLIGILGAGVASLVIRFRRASGVERQQIKWVAFSLVAVVAGFIVTTVASALGVGPWLDNLVSGLAFITHSGRDRDRRAPVPALRPRPRGEEGTDRRDARGDRRRGLRGAGLGVRRGRLRP